MGGDRKWLKLNASYQDGDVVISTAVDTALAEFDNNFKRNAGGPVGSSLGVLPTTRLRTNRKLREL